MRAATTTLLPIITVLVCAIFASGQQLERKVLTKVAPEYSPLLKQNMIGGVVRVVAVVSASGTVRRVEIVGGNPILVTAAQSAVKRWKFAPAEKESQESITFNFEPAGHR